MKEMFKFINKKEMFVVFVIAILMNLTTYGISFALAYFITNPITEQKLFNLLVSLIILYLASMTFKWIYTNKSRIFIYHIEFQAQKYFFNKLQNMKLENIGRYHSAYIQSLIEDASPTYAYIISDVLNNLLPFIIGVGSFVYMACKQSVVAGIVSIIIFAVLFLLNYRMMKVQQQNHKEVAKSRANYDSTLLDFMQNIMTVIKLRVQDFTNKLLDSKTESFLSVYKKCSRQTARIDVVNSLFTNLFHILIIIISIINFKKGQDVLPFLVFYISIINNITEKIVRASGLIEQLNRFNTIKAQLDDVFGETDNSTFIKEWDLIKIDNGVFYYTEQGEKFYIPDFEFEVGDKVSIMGESGQGKTTLLNILSGVYSLKSGAIRYDNRTLHNEKLDVVFISQDIELFDLSIRDNLTLGKDINDEIIFNMFEDAGLMNWYSSLEKGLDEIVGEKGIKLSAGQRQRLNIIRGILIDKDVYFFDEPTSNLDAESEEKIIKMINKYLNDKTYIIVTHREKLKSLCNKHYFFNEHTMRKF